MRPTTASLALAALALAALAGCASDTPTGTNAPALSRLDGAEHGGQQLVAVMTGPEEVPPGDADGTGTARFTLNHGQGEICYEVTVAGIALPATMSHIHEGAAGTGPGRPVVFLTAPDASGTARGCAAVDRAVIEAIRESPSLYYVNVHNAAHPGGAVRGQLQR